MKLWEVLAVTLVQSGFVIGLILIIRWIGKVRGSTSSTSSNEKEGQI